MDDDYYYYGGGYYGGGRGNSSAALGYHLGVLLISVVALTIRLIIFLCRKLCR